MNGNMFWVRGIQVQDKVQIGMTYIEWTSLTPQRKGLVLNTEVFNAFMCPPNSSNNDTKIFLRNVYCKYPNWKFSEYTQPISTNKV